MAITSRGHLQTRLQNVLSSIDRLSSLDSPLYTKQFGKEEQTSLVAIFDNGIDPNPLFSGSIVGRLFIDEEHNLSFATWPIGKEKNSSWRKEILLPHVESFEFEFLGTTRASEHGKKEKVRPITPNLSWHSLHPRSETEVPSMIRLSIREEKKPDPLRFAFILPSSEPFVRYQGKKT